MIPRAFLCLLLCTLLGCATHLRFEGSIELKDASRRAASERWYALAFMSFYVFDDGHWEEWTSSCQSTVMTNHGTYERTKRGMVLKNEEGKRTALRFYSADGEKYLLEEETYLEVREHPEKIGNGFLWKKEK